MIINFVLKRKFACQSLFNFEVRKEKQQSDIVVTITRYLHKEEEKKSLLRINLLFYVHISNVSFFNHKK